MLEFICEVGGWWEFIKGLFYIVVIICSLLAMIPIIRGLNDVTHRD